MGGNFDYFSPTVTGKPKAVSPMFDFFAGEVFPVVPELRL